LLLVHFGTTHDDARARTLDVISAKARQQYPHMTVSECFTSAIVRKRLAARGIEKASVVDALLQLRANGHRSIAVQPSFIIDGKEMALLRKDIEQVRSFFDSITLGTPLLNSIDDSQSLCSILANRHPVNTKQKEHVLFVGHGTKGIASAIYSQLEYMLRDSGHPNHHVATIEGYPTLQTAIKLMKEQGARQVTLVPLLFVAGDHATNDIAVEWKAQIEQEGIRVSVVSEGLGEIEEIQHRLITVPHDTH
jgi:sirohydrochlorin cobaltochelatase